MSEQEKKQGEDEKKKGVLLWPTVHKVVKEVADEDEQSIERTANLLLSRACKMRKEGKLESVFEYQEA